MNAREAALKDMAQYGIIPTSITATEHILVSVFDRDGNEHGAFWLDIRTVGDDHDCMDVRYYAPDGTAMCMGVGSMSFGRGGLSNERKGHGWDGADFLFIMADHVTSDTQQAVTDA